MKYEVKKLVELSKVEISVVFKKAEYDAKYEVELAKAMAEGEAPGFRKGKLPRSMFLKKYGDQMVHNNVMDELINESYREVVEKEKIELVGMPKIDFLTEIADDEWGYKATVAVYPEVVVKDYFGIKAVKEEVVVSEEDIEKEINRVLANSAELEVVEEGKLEKGNVAVFDFCGRVDGVEFEGGKAENYSLEIGSGQFIPGFEDQMVGMKAGEEKVLKVKFPEQYQENLAGKDAEFTVKLHEIKKRVLPELNDDFVKGLEIEGVETVDAYKVMVKDNLTNEKVEASKNKFEDDALTLLCEKNPVVIPQEMIDAEVDNRVKKLESQASQYGFPVDVFLKYQGIESVDQYKELLVPGVKTTIQEELIFDAIVKAEKVKLVKEDYDKYYAEIAKYQRKDLKEVKKALPKANVKERFLLFKARDIVLESVVVK